MEMTETKSINTMQSDRSVNGKYFDLLMEHDFQKQNFQNVFYGGAQNYYIKPQNQDYYIKPIEATPDLSFHVINWEKKTVLAGETDNALSVRKDRIDGKATEGRTIKKLRNEIKEKICAQHSDHPELADFKFIITFVTIFPKTLIGNYENEDVEYKMIRDAIISINRGDQIGEDYAGPDGIDAAMNEEQFFQCLHYIENNPDMTLSGKTMKIVWRKLFKGYEWMPNRRMTVRNALEAPRHVIFTAKNYNECNTIEDIREVLRYYGEKVGGSKEELTDRVIKAIGRRKNNKMAG